MADENLGNLSQEQIQRLANTISEAKNLTNQQEEIIKKVLAGETEIGKLRISYLNQYFDIYSSKLDKIIARKTSALNDTFLVLDKKLDESYKKLSSNIGDLENQINRLASASNSKKSSSSDSTGRDDTAKNNDSDSGHLTSVIDKAIETLAEAYRKEGEARAKEVSSGNSALLKLEKQYQDDRVAQLKQHLNQLAQITGSPLTHFTPTESEPVRPELSNNRIERPAAEAETLADAVTQIISDSARTDLRSNAYEEGSDSDIAKRLDAWRDFYKKNEEERINAILAGAEELEFNQRTVEQKYKDQREQALEAQAKQVESIQNQMIALEVARMEQELGLIDQITQARLDSQQEAIDAEVAALVALNNFNAQVKFSENYSEEAGANRTRAVAAQDSLAETKKREEQMAKERAKLELKYKRQNNGILSKEDAARIEKELANKYKAEAKNEENLSKERARLATIEYQQDRAKERDELAAGAKAIFAKGATLEERKQALYSVTHDENGNFDNGKAISAAVNALSDMVAQLNSKIDSIAKYQGVIDTRLQGSNNKKSSGSYWSQLTKDMMSVGAVTPFFKQEDFANNIKTLVEKGISFDLKQRAFLMTIQEKIANTFNVADGTLLRLIRLQQEDSTAGRLGMESALNSFLNNMYETSEYLSDVAGSVRGSLEEMEALMGGAAATEIEYQIQKWMGSLYSVGMSSEAVTSIASALGQIAAGQIEALTNNTGAGNLLVMAANNAGIPIADILTNGLNSKETNNLLQATVNYLAEIAEASKDNKVVQQQLAGVFGVKASDLKAATNLADSTKNIYKTSLTYDNMIKQLNNMAGSMSSRTSLGEMMTNVWENGQYTLASSMANNPASYLLYKVASLLQDTTGGIDLPFVNVMGFGVDLNTTVANLMRVGSLAGGVLGSLGSMISGLGSSFNGRSMLNKMGISSGSGLAVTPRGSGGGIGSLDGGGAQTTSGSGYVGNASGSDIKDSTIQESEDSKDKQMIEAKEEEEENQVNILNMYVIKMYELLDEVASGKRSFNVKVAGYGLTKSNISGGSQGGVSGLLENGSTSNTAGISPSNNASSSFGASGLDFGGWTLI